MQQLFLITAQLSKTSPIFTGTESSSPCTQKPAASVWLRRIWIRMYPGALHILSDSVYLDVITLNSRTRSFQGRGDCRQGRGSKTVARVTLEFRECHCCHKISFCCYCEGRKAQEKVLRLSMVWIKTEKPDFELPHLTRCVLYDTSKLLSSNDGQIWDSI